MELVAQKTIICFRAIKEFPLKEMDQGRHHFSRVKREIVMRGSHGGAGGQGEARSSSRLPARSGRAGLGRPASWSRLVSANQAEPPPLPLQPGQVPPSL